MYSLYVVYFELALRCRYAPSAPTDIYIYNCNVVHTYIQLPHRSVFTSANYLLPPLPHSHFRSVHTRVFVRVHRIAAMTF